MYIFNIHTFPGWFGSVDWVLFYALKGWPEIPIESGLNPCREPAGGSWLIFCSHTDVALSLSLFFLKINKKIVKKIKSTLWSVLIYIHLLNDTTINKTNISITPSVIHSSSFPGNHDLLAVTIDWFAYFRISNPCFWRFKL